MIAGGELTPITTVTELDREPYFLVLEKRGIVTTRKKLLFADRRGQRSPVVVTTTGLLVVDIYLTAASNAPLATTCGAIAAPYRPKAAWRAAHRDARRQHRLWVRRQLGRSHTGATRARIDDGGETDLGREPRLQQ
jgi:hypothetical protein